MPDDHYRSPKNYMTIRGQVYAVIEMLVKQQKRVGMGGVDIIPTFTLSAFDLEATKAELLGNIQPENDW